VGGPGSRKIGRFGSPASGASTERGTIAAKAKSFSIVVSKMRARCGGGDQPHTKSREKIGGAGASKQICATAVAWRGLFV